MTESTPLPPRTGPPKGAYFAVIGIIAVVVFIAWGLSETNLTQPLSGPAPDFTLTLFEGYTGGLNTPALKLSDLRGQVVLVNFWASWCIPCEEEAPALEATWRAYRDRGVVFLGVDWADNYNDALSFLQRFNVTYANGPDVGTKIGPLYHTSGAPETFLIDRSGDIVFFKAAPITEQELAAELDRALAEP